MLNVILYLLLGMAAGVLSGLIGLGGGTIIIPALVLLFGFTELKAQGTTLALMIPPIGILAALIYYKKGFVDLGAAGLICLGFVFGGLFGAKIAVGLPNVVLQRAFGIFLFFVSLKMVFAK
jgi:uncharacterized protein